jgi:Flp pilus assembly protein TadD
MGRVGYDGDRTRRESGMDAKEDFQQGQMHFMKDEMGPAVEAFTRALEKGHDPVMSHLSRGTAYVKMKESLKAVGDFTKVLELEPDNARARLFRGAALMSLERFEEAIPDLTRATELKPDDGRAFLARSTCYAQVGREDEAALDLKQALLYATAAVEGFVDTMGIVRTQFDRAMALMTGERKAPSIELTEEELAKLKEWLKEEVSED